MLTAMLLAVLGSISLPVASPGMEVPESTVFELADRTTYTLGPGDIVTVVVEGGSSQVLLSAGVSPWMEYTIGGDGYLSVSGIGALNVSGLTVDEAQQLLQRIASGYYPSIHVTLSLVKPRKLRVSVGGMVNQPGIYLLTALNRVSDAVLSAGGISTLGSREGTMFTEDGDTIHINLNVNGESVSFVSDPFLTNNAGIIIDVCRNPVYILSNENALETRELLPGEQFESLLARMGGVTGNLDLPDCRIVRDETMIPVWNHETGFSDVELVPGDTLILVMFSDSIVVGGAVNLPGPVQYDPSGTIPDYVIAAGGAVNTAGNTIVVQRNGRKLDGNVENARLLPGDAIEVKYSWFSRNSAMITAITSAISIGLTIYAINR